ncbi:hypothetical protein BDIM_26120 [Brevundimonas diminuta ATCC 11568]|nr:hypothetical protein BDIM_26120 [Brevundimonas diminuta ATCC 11568]
MKLARRAFHAAVRPSLAVILGLDPRIGPSVCGASARQSTPLNSILGSSPRMTAEMQVQVRRRCRGSCAQAARLREPSDSALTMPHKKSAQVVSARGANIAP